MSPDQYNELVNVKTARLRDEASKKRGSLYINPREKPEQDTEGVFTILASMVGMVGGFIACICYTNKTESFAVGITTWIVIFILSIIIGAIITVLYNKAGIQRLENEHVHKRSEKDSLERELEQISKDAEIEKENYKIEFENNIQSLLPIYSSSEFTKEIVEWITPGFSKAIDSADRRDHNETIFASFKFKVFSSKVGCNLGTYDFVLKRIEELDSPLKQMALARAIALAVQDKIKQNYPKDASGTDISIAISYSYDGSNSNDKLKHADVSMGYTAANGNFKKAQSW